jgi:dTDP-glucose 4,6-dehydratase
MHQEERMSPNVLVTGGAGFIGSHIVDALVARRDRVTVLDRLSTGGAKANLEHLGDDVRFVLGDVRDRELVSTSVAEVDAVIHAAAESHVDRSIAGPRDFVDSNVLGTQTLLDAVREHGRRMLMVSTDEVYGPGDRVGGLFDEDAAIRPRSPYAASKAAADLLCQASVATYGLEIVVVRGTNAYGPRQIERVMPTYILAALEGRPIPVYGRGEQRREFLHVTDWVRGALTAFDHGQPGVVYNVGRGHELSNRELAERICALAEAHPSSIEYVQDRPGHDFRYGVSADRLAALGWRPEVPFEEGLVRTVTWYREHRDWLRAAHPGPVVTAPLERKP